ncbi:hypothetical protein [Pararhizobium haloflavum]|uniref:hypothetical protein n=1 Tax=Pararhizobium haloflavum TaxID=2037914 RepID=UPI000C19124F|nr:hypothetical protein [Pararhizobium haloflavum]
MAEIDRHRLARDVAEFLKLRGYSYREACFVWPALNVAMLSRACSGQVLSAGNLLALCRAFALNPFDYLAAEKAPSNPAVTEIGSRETRSRDHGGRG